MYTNYLVENSEKQERRERGSPYLNSSGAVSLIFIAARQLEEIARRYGSEQARTSVTNTNCGLMNRHEQGQKERGLLCI